MTIRKILLPLLSLFACAVLLFGTHAFLRPVAAHNAAEEQRNTMQQLLPGAVSFSREEYHGDDPNITAVFRGENGCVIETSVIGYVDTITLWVGVSESGKVTGLTVRSIAETPGLGQRALRDRAFLEQFLGSSGSAAASEEIDALSGATVTTKAITKAVNSAAAYVSGADVSSGATEWSH